MTHCPVRVATVAAAVVAVVAAAMLGEACSLLLRLHHLLPVTCFAAMPVMLQSLQPRWRMTALLQ
jgi:hypothetical protein